MKKAFKLVRFARPIVFVFGNEVIAQWVNNPKQLSVFYINSDGVTKVFRRYHVFVSMELDAAVDSYLSS